MKPTDVVYPVFLLVCIFASVAVARFDGKRTIVADDGTRRQLQHKVKWRRNRHIVTFHEPHDRENDLKRSPTEDRKTEKGAPKTGTTEKTPSQPPVVATQGVEEKGTNNKTKGGGAGGENNTYGAMVTDLVDMKTIFFVLIGITFSIIGCFIFRIVRSRSRRKTKKYGILATRGNDVELTPLEQDDEDEDMTVFDVNST